MPQSSENARVGGFLWSAVAVLGLLVSLLVVHPTAQAAVGDEIGTFPVPDGPFGLAVSQQQLFVSMYDSPDSVAVLDPDTGTPVAPDPIGVANRYPTGLALSPDGSLFAGNDNAERTVGRYAAGTGTALAPISHAGLSTSPYGVDVWQGKLYVANFGNGNVVVFDIATGSLVLTIPATGQNWDVAVDPESGKLFASDFAADLVRVYDAESGSSLGEIALEADSEPVGVAVSAGLLYVAGSNSKKIYVFDTDGNPTDTIAAAHKPFYLAALPGRLFASHFEDLSVSVFRIESVPSAPTGVVAAAGDARVSVSWQVPADDGGAAITGYTATASPGGASCTTAGATSCSIAPLVNGTSYTVTVTAKNRRGRSIPGSASGPVTPVGVEPGPSPAPVAPTEVPAPTPAPNPSPGLRPRTRLNVDARSASDRLPVGRKVRLVRVRAISVQSGGGQAASAGAVITVRAQCWYRSQKLVGAERRANCSVSEKRRRSGVLVEGMAKRSNGLRIRVRIVARSPGHSKKVWRRSWQVQRSHRADCDKRG